MKSQSINDRLALDRKKLCIWWKPSRRETIEGGYHYYAVLPGDFCVVVHCMQGRMLLRKNLGLKLKDGIGL